MFHYLFSGLARLITGDQESVVSLIVVLDAFVGLECLGLVTGLFSHKIGGGHCLSLVPGVENTQTHNLYNSLISSDCKYAVTVDQLT